LGVDRVAYLNEMHKRWDIDIDLSEKQYILNNRLLNHIMTFFRNNKGKGFPFIQSMISAFYHNAGEEAAKYDINPNVMINYVKKKIECIDFYRCINFFLLAVAEYYDNSSIYDWLFDVMREDIIISGNLINIIRNNDGAIMIIPAGAKELDEPLVNDILNWLIDYPRARKNLISALEKYDAKNIKECLNLLYSSLEDFLQEFFENKKNLENQKQVIGDFLKEKRGIPEMQNLIIKMYDYYALGMNEITRHGDKAIYEDIEYMLYQTGALIRILIQLDRKP